jgi:hypothetical protein
MTLIHTILASSSDDPIKVLFAIGFAVVWAVLAILGGIAKKKGQGQKKKSWEEILGQMSGQPGGTPPTMPNRGGQAVRPAPMPMRPPPIPSAKAQQKKQSKKAMKAVPIQQPRVTQSVPPLVQTEMSAGMARQMSARQPGGVPGGNPAIALLVTAEHLRAQVVVAEILGKPVALREEWGGE